MMSYDDIESATKDITGGLLDNCLNRVALLNAIKAIVKEYSKSVDEGDIDKSIHFSHLITDILSMFTTSKAVQDKLKLKVVADKWHILAQLVDDVLKYHTTFSI